MADLELELGVPSGDQTLPAVVGKVRRVKLPLGTRTFSLSSAYPFFLELDPTQEKEDEDDSDTTKRHWYPANAYTFTPPGSGQEGNALDDDVFIYVVGTVSGQPYWVTPQVERGT